jgi:hypothetical protein
MNITFITTPTEITGPGIYAPQLANGNRKQLPEAAVTIEQDIGDGSSEDWCLRSEEAGCWLCDGGQAKTWPTLGQVRRFLGTPYELKEHGLWGWLELWAQ